MRKIIKVIGLVKCFAIPNNSDNIKYLYFKGKSYKKDFKDELFAAYLRKERII